MPTRTLAATAGAFLAAHTLAQRTQFTALGQFSGANSSTALALSADGNRAVGAVIFPLTGPRASLWQRAGGISLLNLPANIANNTALDISTDGTMFLGQFADKGRFHATLQIGSGPATDLGIISAGVGALPYAMSANGHFVVGEAEFAAGPQGFLWNAAKNNFRVLTGFEGAAATAVSISADGSVIVGESIYLKNGQYITNAARWINSSTTPLPLTGDPDTGLSRALAVSDDGRWIVGTVGDSNGRSAFRWSLTTGFEILGTLSGDNVAEASSVSADGSVITGVSANYDRERPFIWREGRGMNEFNNLLRQHSSLPSGWSDFVVRNVSADGTTVCGFGAHRGLIEGFVATLGCFADYDNNGFLTGVDFDMFIHAFESGSFRADLNADGFVTGEDFDNFVAGFEEGC